MKVTRVLYSKGLAAYALDALTEQARCLGVLRSEVWQRYGSINGLGVTHRQVRDAWLAQGRTFPVLVDAWKETLRDAMADIKANREAAKVKARRCLSNRQDDEQEQIRLYTLLKYDRWLEDPYLHRLMRRYWRRGKNHTHNQIVVRSDKYSIREENGQCVVRVPGLVKGKRIAIPLNTTVEFRPTGTLRLLLRGGRVECHFQVEAKAARPAGTARRGVDKGYREAFTDSDGNQYGKQLGELLSRESDALCETYQKRNKLHAIAKAKPHKRHAIEQNNLGRKKLDQRKHCHTVRVRTEVFTAAHQLYDQAGEVVEEDLTWVSNKPKTFYRGQNRRLSGWVKGVLHEALETVAAKRGAKPPLRVNAAYTSQADSWTEGLLLGQRDGRRFYRANGVVEDAEHNAARNALARAEDPEITLHTPYKQVKAILVRRTQAYLDQAQQANESQDPNRTELTVPGSSYLAAT